MAKEEDDETRLYQCARKYELMVKQFDELVELMNTRSTKLPKRCKSTAVSAASASQPDNDEALVQTITRFLHELNPNPNPNPNPTDPNCLTNTRNRDPQ